MQTLKIEQGAIKIMGHRKTSGKTGISYDINQGTLFLDALILTQI